MDLEPAESQKDVRDIRIWTSYRAGLNGLDGGHVHPIMFDDADVASLDATSRVPLPAS